MKKSITLFQTIDEKLVEEMGCTVKLPRAFYEYGGNKIELKTEAIEGGASEYVITDDAASWNIVDHNLILEGEVDIKDVSVLFGEGGISSEFSTLGVGIIWKSKPTDIRGAGKLFDFSVNDTNSAPLKRRFRKTFKKAELKEGVEFSVVVYLVDPAGNEATAFAKDPGAILGEIGAYDFVLEGNGSQFTVVEKHAPGEPLWTIECDWDDPTYNQFTETVRIVLNTAHPGWELFDDKNTRKELLKEIMASGMHIIISMLSEDEYEQDGDYERGSVSEAVAYLISRAELDTTSAQGIAKTMRKYLDGAMK